MKSLERQLHFWLSVSLVVLMTAIWIIGNYGNRHLTENFAVSRLVHDAESLIAALDFSSGSTTHLEIRHLSQVYHQPYSGHYYVILADNEAKPIYSRSLWDNRLEVPRLAVGQSRHLHMNGPSGQRLLVWMKGFRKQGVDFTLAVAEDFTSINEQQKRFRYYFALLAIMGLVGLLFVQRTVVHRAVAKLDPVREDIKRLSNGETGKLSDDVPKEVLPLVQEVNHLLQLLTRRMERSRNSLGNLAHALKGPLNLVVQYFDQQEKGLNSIQDTQARGQLERIEELMERELKRARLAGKGVPGQRFNARRELPDLVGFLRQIYADKDLSIDFKIGSDVHQFGDREDMLELIGNLLDNACKWAKSHVSCTISDNAAYRIVIEDDGEGLSAPDLGSLIKRGIRLDETMEGHGLGLGIVKDIVDLYGGTIEFLHSERHNGLKVMVTFPN